MTGSIPRQGTHHGAQTSRSTGSGEASTCSSKRASADLDDARRRAQRGPAAAAHRLQASLTRAAFTRFVAPQRGQATVAPRPVWHFLSAKARVC